MEQTDMPMTRAQHDHAVAVKLGIIHTLKDNLGDEFSAQDIAAAMIDPPDMTPLNVGGILKAMIADGLVAKTRAGGQNLYRLQKKALAWVPPPYDWRGNEDRDGGLSAAQVKAKAPGKAKAPAPAKVNGTPAATPVAQIDPKRQRKPADSHPWVHPPAVTKAKPERGAITRPLPVHLETPAELSLEAMRRVGYCPEVPLEPASGMGALLVVDPTLGPASCQPTVDDSGDSGQAILDDSSSSEIPNSSETNHPEIPDSSPGVVVAHEAPNAAQQTLPAESHEDEQPAQHRCGGHCANHARASDDQELRQVLDRAMVEMRDLTNDLAISQRDLEGALAKINALAVELEALEDRNACLADDLAISQQERDRLHEQVRAYARQHTEDQNRIDALMDVARPHLSKGKHGDTARSAAPFGLPVIPKDWIGLLKLTLLDDNAKLVLKIDSEGGGAYARLKADAVLDGGSADFLPGVMDGLIGLMDYLFPHLAVSHPDHSADTGNMVGSEADHA